MAYVPGGRGGLEAGEKCSFMKYYRHQLQHKRFVSATTCHNTFSFLPQFDQKNGLNPDLKKPLESKFFIFLRDVWGCGHKNDSFRPHLNTRKNRLGHILPQKFSFTTNLQDIFHEWTRFASLVTQYPPGHRPPVNSISSRIFFSIHLDHSVILKVT